MNFYIPRYCNVIIDRETGDGFRSLVLPILDMRNSIVISDKNLITQCYKPNNINAITIHRLRKTVDEYDDIKTVYLDLRLPRSSTKSFKALMKLSAGKQIVFINKPRDCKALSVAMALMSVTKKCSLKIITFNNFMFKRRY